MGTRLLERQRMLVLVCQYSFSEIQTVTHFATLPCHWDLGIMTQYYDFAIVIYAPGDLLSCRRDAT
ncbi:hypothetical protein XNC1_1800 [Xenorhabdus nematophila ATCC 19061]|uniref:Uncharacterized protein n=1 Tax=Xenorhabdus nematophila (strain ATCC 19061 / DSM 3370 / CCUG 14189 / LMG 1036 / NCIMB 9965 / AN6) TaxID=406817 RepID=D3VCZ4_XENNA|nr:hypothetical protein XNC1_1800 [Xenorhabdus nematophila ATCC 19061]